MMGGAGVTLANPWLRQLVAVDLFAGGGGASEGIRRALGRAPILAVNHDPAAIAMHAANHPNTVHLTESVFDVRPRSAVSSSIDLLWASPDCTHFSRAKGGKPRKKEIRALAWVVVKWAREAAPRVICLENVPEFVTWGPLDEHGHPDKARAGETFREFVAALEGLGYAVGWRNLVAADYGAPTSRKRFFLVARRDGLPIVWPEPTHGPGREHPYRTAAACIDWSIPCPSIFDRKKPLAVATQRRIAEGLRRYVLGGTPYVVRLPSGERVAPYLTRTDMTSDGRLRGLGAPGEPLRTLTTANGHALVAAFLAKHYTGVVGHGVDRPLGTVTGQDHHSLVAAHLTKFYGTSTGATLDGPMPTVTAGAGGGHAGLVAAVLCKYYGSGGQWQAIDEPLHTVVSKARFGLVTVTIDGEEYAIVDIGMRMLQPRELARAHGFADSYVLTGTKTEQVARIGNSVPVDLVAAVVRAQFAAPYRGEQLALDLDDLAIDSDPVLPEVT